MTEPHVSEKLREIRNRAGYTVREFARLLGFEDRYSTYSSYENKSKKNVLQIGLVKQMLPLLVDRGEPPITPGEVWALAGLTAGDDGIKDVVKRAERATVPPDDSLSVRIKEVDISPQAGAGALSEIAGGDGDPHVTLASWSIPKPFLESYLADTNGLAVVRVIGNSMEPDFMPGERVMVDTTHRVLSHDGVYVLWNGIGVVIKQLQLVPKSDPPKVRIISVNKTYETDEVLLDDIEINGRVVGKWLWK